MEQPLRRARRKWEDIIEMELEKVSVHNEYETEAVKDRESSRIIGSNAGWLTKRYFKYFTRDTRKQRKMLVQDEKHRGGAHPGYGL
jgi:hypothetical protein